RRPIDGRLIPVSAVIAARDEATSILAAIDALNSTDHRTLEIVVVDDGSTDGMQDVIRRCARVRDGVTLRIIGQPALGKAAALNRGLSDASHDIVVCVDADTRVDRGALA